MVSKEDIFDISGPKHLTDIDWKNADHRRSVTASLIQGVYVLEAERQTIRKNLPKYAQPWWQSFKFQLHQTLTEHDGGCIFGAIYEYINGKCPAPADDSDVPRYVIAFRGTHLGQDSALEDLNLVLKCLGNDLQESDRSKRAIQYVDNFVTLHGSSNVWLAGHSLGSAMALIVGRNLILKKDCFLQAYLFNPPFASIHLEMFTNMSEKVKSLLRVARGVIKIGLAIALEPRTQKQKQKTDSFVSLSRWTPHLFVNKGDYICSQYISYFKNRVEADPEMMNLPAKNCTTRNLVSHVLLGKDLKDAIHYLPSANLVVNHPPSRKRTSNNSDIVTRFLDAHGICQWWDPELICSCQSIQIYSDIIHNLP